MVTRKSRLAAVVAGALFALGATVANAKGGGVLSPITGPIPQEKILGVGDIVFDPVHTVETIFGHAAQLSQWAEQLQRMQQQYQKLQQTYETLKDPRAYVRNIANSWLEKQVRAYMPADFENAMNVRYSASSTVGPFANAVQRVVSEYPQKEWWLAFNGLTRYSGATVKGYDNKLRASTAMMAGALVAQRDLSSRFNSVETLIDTAANTEDLKGSVDTSSRVQAEVAFLMIEALRMQAQQAYLASNEAQRETSSRASALRLSRWRDRSW